MAYLAVGGAFAAWLLSFAAAAQTFTATTVMPVSVDLVSSCNVTASDLDFGSYVATVGVPGRAQALVQLQCTTGTIVEVALDAGLSPGATTSDRRMVSGAGQLRYGLFQDPGRSTNWGNTPGVDTLEIQTVVQLQSVTIYGELPARQQVPPGTYSDLITIHLFY